MNKCLKLIDLFICKSLARSDDRFLTYFILLIDTQTFLSFEFEYLTESFLIFDICT